MAYNVLVGETIMTRGHHNFDFKNTADIGTAPVHAAIGSCEHLEKCISAGGDVNARDEMGMTPLHYAAERKLIRALTLVLEKGADVHATDRMGQTALHLAAEAGFLAGIQMLVSHKSDLNARDRVGQTPLHYAAARGRTESGRFLLNHGADSTLRDDDGADAFFYAAKNGHTLMAHTLKKLNSEPSRFAIPGRDSVVSSQPKVS